MNKSEFKITGMCKSRIKCRSFVSLKIRQIEEIIIEFNKITANSIFEGMGDLEIPNKNEWIDAFIELNTKEPDIKIILPLLEKELKELSELVKCFENKVEELKKDNTIPKKRQKYTDGRMVEEIDYTTLEAAEIMLSDYTKQHDFVKECIVELKN